MTPHIQLQIFLLTVYTTDKKLKKTAMISIKDILDFYG